MVPDDVLQQVHRRFAGADPALPNGFAEHTPMGADAMVALGLDPDAVAAWAAHHEPEPLATDAPVAATRDRLRVELADGPWTEVVRRHAPTLVSAVDAHLFHGLIRTAHAVRSLERHDDDDARAELALGLAAWSLWADRPLGDAATPGAAGADATTPEAVPGADDPDASILDAATRGAGAFLSRPSIITLHAVTAPLAFLLLSPTLDDAGRRAGAAAFARTHAGHPPLDGAELAALGPAAPLSADEVALVAEHWDAHPAKLVEACARGHERTGDPVFLLAARRVLGR